MVKYLGSKRLLIPAILEQVRAFQEDMPFAVIGGTDRAADASLLASGADVCVDNDHLGELVPSLLQALQRRAEQQWHSVKALRRKIHSLAAARLLQARAG